MTIQFRGKFLNIILSPFNKFIHHFTFTNRSQTVVMPFASKNRIPKTIALEDEFPTTKLFND